MTLGIHLVVEHAFNTDCAIRERVEDDVAPDSNCKVPEAHGLQRPAALRLEGQLPDSLVYLPQVSRRLLLAPMLVRVEPNVFQSVCAKGRRTILRIQLRSMPCRGDDLLHVERAVGAALFAFD